MSDRHPPSRCVKSRARPGVSTASASRALRGRAAVSADLRRRILAAADRLGYAPNLAARALAGRGSGLVGVLAETLEEPLLAAVVMGLERRLAEAGYSVLIAAPGAAPGQSLLALRALLGRGVEAVLLAEPAHAQRTRCRSAHPGRALVSLGGAGAVAKLRHRCGPPPWCGACGALSRSTWVTAACGVIGQASGVAEGSRTRSPAAIPRRARRRR